MSLSVNLIRLLQIFLSLCAFTTLTLTNAAQATYVCHFSGLLELDRELILSTGRKILSSTSDLRCTHHSQLGQELIIPTRVVLEERSLHKFSSYPQFTLNIPSLYIDTPKNFHISYTYNSDLIAGDDEIDIHLQIDPTHPAHTVDISGGIFRMQSLKQR